MLAANTAAHGSGREAQAGWRTNEELLELLVLGVLLVGS